MRQTLIETRAESTPDLWRIPWKLSGQTARLAGDNARSTHEHTKDRG
ncbi:hypothetical protein [Corallococcus macrosporus]|uniref:Uncharacterized protein n=1 Tax=Myxococcus fulvus (strain ATCC BAA-855 / HW-1) TaxID=483219 RepID=F8CBI8_MYXFH|nr:hypothetical protein [Corallococcus macrosporus]AEI63395.1 hypothetical protein LILAB_07400 [Corallococcus macrosporus]